MKDGWKTKKIGDVCSLMTGGTPSKNKPEYFLHGNIQWLVSGDIHQKEIFECEGRITEEGMKNSNAKYLPVNSVIIALSGQGKTRGTVALLRTNATCNQSLVSIYPNDFSELQPEYLYWNLHGRYEEIRRITGDDEKDRRGLNMSLVRNIEIPIPPISEQQRIVALLDETFAALNTVHANAKRNLVNAREVYEAVANEIFKSDGKGWEQKRLDDVCTLQRGFDLPTRDRIEGKYPLVSSSGVTDTQNEGKVKAPGVATGRSGSIGNVFYLEEDYWPLNTVLYVKDFHGNYEKFIYHFLKWFNLSRFASGAGVPTLNRNNVHDELVKIPNSVAEQHAIVRQLDAIAAQTEKIEEIYRCKVDGVEELRKSILQKAFEGAL
jgi:type I restriction enzyme, S subunit